MSEWLTKAQVADRLAVSRATVDRHRVPWQETAVPRKIRVKILAINKLPRFYAPDVDAMLTTEPPRFVCQKLFGRHWRMPEDRQLSLIV